MKENETKLKSGREYRFTRSWLSVFQNAVDNFDDLYPGIGKEHPKAREVQLDSLKFRIRTLQKEVDEYEQHYPLNARFNKIYNNLLATVGFRSTDAYHEKKILRTKRSRRSSLLVLKIRWLSGTNTETPKGKLKPPKTAKEVPDRP